MTQSSPIKYSVLLTDERKGPDTSECTYLLARELYKHDWLQALVAPTTSWLAEQKNDLPFFNMEFYADVDMPSVFGLYQKIKAAGVKVIHCTGYRDLIASALARRLPGAPPTVLLMSHHSPLPQTPSPLLRWAYRECRGVTAKTPELLSDSTSRLTLNEDVHVAAVWSEPEKLADTFGALYEHLWELEGSPQRKRNRQPL